jgi:hypothetical protein
LTEGTNSNEESESLTIPVLQNAEEAAEIKKRRAFRKFSYRGVDLDKYVPKHHKRLHHQGLA